MDRIEVHVSSGYRTVMWLVGFFTLGVGALAMWVATRSWPALVDREGVTPRNGRRHRWVDLTEARPVTVVNPHGQRITGRLDLVFKDGTVRVVPHSLAEGPAVVQFISAVLGTRVREG